MSMFFSPLAGAEATIVDDFEDGDISEYRVNTGSFSTQTTEVTNGSVALQGTPSSGSVYIRSESGLDTYPAQGDTFRVNVYLPESDTLGALMFGTQSGASNNDEAYRAEVNNTGSKIAIVLQDGSTTTVLSSQSVNVPGGEWLELEVAWATDGTITITLFDSAGSQLAQTSATDTTYASGGIGFRAYDGNDQTAIYFDHVRILTANG